MEQGHRHGKGSTQNNHLGIKQVVYHARCNKAAGNKVGFRACGVADKHRGRRREHYTGKQYRQYRRNQIGAPYYRRNHRKQRQSNVRRQHKSQGAFYVAVNLSCAFYGVGHRQEVIVAHKHIAAFGGGRRGSSRNGNSHVRFLQKSYVVRLGAYPCHHFPLLSQKPQNLHALRGKYSRKNAHAFKVGSVGKLRTQHGSAAAYSDLSCHGGSGLLVVAGYHNYPDSRFYAGFNRIRHGITGGVLQRHKSHIFIPYIRKALGNFGVFVQSRKGNR